MLFLVVRGLGLFLLLQVHPALMAHQVLPGVLLPDLELLLQGGLAHILLPAAHKVIQHR